MPNVEPDTYMAKNQNNLKKTNNEWMSQHFFPNLNRHLLGRVRLHNRLLRRPRECQKCQYLFLLNNRERFTDL